MEKEEKMWTKKLFTQGLVWYVHTQILNEKRKKLFSMPASYVLHNFFFSLAFLLLTILCYMLCFIFILYISMCSLLLPLILWRSIFAYMIYVCFFLSLTHSLTHSSHDYLFCRSENCFASSFFSMLMNVCTCDCMKEWWKFMVSFRSPL